MSALLPLSFEGVGYAVRGQELLCDLNFQLEAGSTTVVLGPNGAGKSLTLRLAHGLLAPTSGRVRWANGQAEGPPRPQAGQVGHAMVFERPVLLRRSARANVEYALAVAGRPRPERRDRADAFLERTGLSALAERPARALSAGEQQRLALARAWALEPEVLFLDEPTAALDPSATRQVEELIARVSEDGAKVVMTTHDLGQARRLADEVLFLHRGSLRERSAAEPFFAGPRSREASAFLKGELVW
jgi:tungstate transport system ATP-binding protein